MCCFIQWESNSSRRVGSTRGDQLSTKKIQPPTFYMQNGWFTRRLTWGGSRRSISHPASWWDYMGELRLRDAKIVKISCWHIYFRVQKKSTANPGEKLVIRLLDSVVKWGRGSKPGLECVAPSLGSQSTVWEEWGWGPHLTTESGTQTPPLAGVVCLALGFLAVEKTSNNGPENTQWQGWLWDLE